MSGEEFGDKLIRRLVIGRHNVCIRFDDVDEENDLLAGGGLKPDAAIHADGDLERRKLLAQRAEQLIGVGEEATRQLQVHLEHKAILENAEAARLARRVDAHQLGLHVLASSENSTINQITNLDTLNAERKLK